MRERLQACVKAERTLVVTSDTARYSDRNTVCLKELTFLLIRQHKLKVWSVVKDCYGNIS